ncbi:MAG: RnfABCDGE type electron transport complex subunit D [Candidatus Thioglobus sp.]|nr:RnfABCDGE type electron transport complex subunit D [Candidatus Thioglobus sp.]
MMRQVIYALLLGVIAEFYFFGWGVFWQILLGVSTAILVESAFLKIRKLPIKPVITDGSGALTAMLLAISIPSIAPWWIVVLGVAFALIFGKQLYGGLGHNPFNPAMLGYAFLLISYPLQMTTWAAEFLNFAQSFEAIFGINLPDALTGATKLDSLKTQLALGKSATELSINSISQAWINLGFLLGGLYLLARKIILWHIPIAFLSGVLTISSLLFLIDNSLYLPPQNHLLLGGTMLGAFFIATDPVSAATTPKGRLIYGFFIGILVVIIRVFGGYPDGVAFAVLLMNIAVPLIDYYTQPKVFGQ